MMKIDILFFCKIKCKIKLKNWMKFNYAYYIFFDKFLGLASFNIPLMLVKMEAYNKLRHTTLSVYDTQGLENSVIAQWLLP